MNGVLADKEPIMHIYLFMAFMASTIVSGCSASHAAGPQAPPDQRTGDGLLAADAPVDEILDALHKVGEGLKSFDADVRLTETDAALGTDVVWTGRAWYQKLGEGEARLRVSFDRSIANERTRTARREYLLAGGRLQERDYGRRLEINRQVLRPGEKINLLRLGEGPFPLPIGQPKEEVRRMFEVEKKPLAAEDPEQTLRLELTPRQGTPLARRFSLVRVWVDPKSHMPRRVETESDTQTRATDLDNMRLNPDLTDADFTLPKIDEDEWSIRDEPYSD
jgi:hypothetical protein